jgi:Tfp pilus assembly protein PilN
MRAVNLLPADERAGSSRGAGRSQGGAYAVLALLAGLALLALVYGSARHQIASRHAKLVALEARVQQVQSNAAKLAPYSSFIALREQRLHAVSQLVNSRFDWAHAFHELGRVLPAHVSITSLTGLVGVSTGSSSAPASPASPATAAASAAGGSVTSATPPGAVPTFTMTGCAKSQSVVALTLNRLHLIDGATTVTLQSSTKGASGPGSGTGSGAGGCPNAYSVFTVAVTFAPLPASSATSSPPVSTPVSSGTGAAKSKGGSQ